MSTGLECLFVERNSSEWYYLLERYNSPKNAWDWLDYADAYGPFKSETSAMVHLSTSHPNPGGYSVIKLKHYKSLPLSRKEKLEGLIKYASKRGTNVIVW